MWPIGVSGRFLVALAAGATLVIGSGFSVAANASTTGPRADLTKAARTLPNFGNPHGHDYVPPAGRAVSSGHPDHVIGTGNPAGCTSAAVVRAVAAGGVITFNCGSHPVTITMNATAKIVNTSHRVVLDGGGKVTLSGGRKHQILYMDTCDRKQQITTSDCYDQEWPNLIVQNITFENGNSTVRQTSNTQFGGGGGGAIFDLGGQLRVVNSRFTDNSCYRFGPDLGGGAIRALSQWHLRPVYVTGSTFSGGQCSNGAALSSIGVSWVVLNSLMTGNTAIGYGANPAMPGTLGGGSGGAIYADGSNYSVMIGGTVIRGNQAREGGGAIFFVSNNRTGKLTIKDSALHTNPSAVFWTRAYPGIYFIGSGHPRVINSEIN
jgi:hypothetical protein